MKLKKLDPDSTLLGITLLVWALGLGFVCLSVGWVLGVLSITEPILK